MCASRTIILLSAGATCFRGRASVRKHRQTTHDSFLFGVTLTLYPFFVTNYRSLWEDEQPERVAPRLGRCARHRHLRVLFEKRLVLSPFINTVVSRLLNDLRQCQSQIGPISGPRS